MKKRTFKRQIFLYSIIMIIVLISVLIFHIEINRRLTNHYKQSYTLYQVLGNFYDNTNLAHEKMKNYLYTTSEQELNQYNQYIAKANANLNEIKSYEIITDVEWRFELLSNMLESYSEQSYKVIAFRIEENENYGNEYNKLLDINNAIIRTSENYYKLMTVKFENTLIYMDKEKKYIDLISIGILGFYIIGILIYTWIIQRSFTNPIDQLVNNLDDIKAGIFDFHNILTKSKEMEVLCIALQDLSDNIYKNLENEKEKAQLKTELLIKENENLKKDEMLISTELKMLQSQMNPHFVFNSMNMIYQQSILDQAETTVEMIEKMTECMRYTMNQKSRTSTLEMELNFVKNYIYIQNKRFEGRIQCELQVEKDLPNLRIPAMIIEPLIDNSMKYGLANVESGGLITIHVYKKEQTIKIHISDNGKGMASEDLEILIMNKFRKSNKEEGLGLYNISRRLYMYFGDKAIISLNSFEDCGFETIITLPIEEEK